MNGVKLPLTTLKTDFDDAVDRKSVDDAPIFMATKHTNACKNKLQNWYCAATLTAICSRSIL